MNDLVIKNNDQPTNNIDVSCIQTVGLKHAKGLFVLLETNFFAENGCNISLVHYLVLIAFSSFLIRIFHFKIHVNKIPDNYSLGLAVLDELQNISI
jgi:hypothetical protein